MIYDSHQFEFPGRRYAFRHADPTRATGLAALRAIANAVEPTVVELTDEANVTSHLVAGEASGGTYMRTHVHAVEHITDEELVAWFTEQTNARTITRLTIGDGWYRVDAHAGDALRVPAGELKIVEHHERRALRAPTRIVIDAPFGVTLRPDEGTLDLAVQFSAWTDPDGPGFGPFQRLLAELTAAGWILVEQPAPVDLAWRKPTPVIPLTPRRPVAVAVPAEAFVAVPGSRVVLGISESERETLVERLVVIDRETLEAEGTLGFGGYDEPKRRGEIREALAPSLGHTEVDVPPFAIHRRPVTNAMWRAFMTATRAAAPAAWPAGKMPSAEDPVAGVSPDEAAAFAKHHGWQLPSEAEWQLAATRGVLEQLDGASEYTRDAFDRDPSVCCARNNAPRAPACLEARRGVARDHRFKFARFRCVSR